MAGELIVEGCNHEQTILGKDDQSDSNDHRTSSGRRGHAGINQASFAQTDVASAKPLSGEEIIATIGGNTLKGKTSEQENWTEYYEPSGDIRGIWQGVDRYSGTWSVKGDKFCLDYNGSDWDSCNGMAIDGNNVFFLNGSGKPVNADRPYELLEGNARNL